MDEIKLKNTIQEYHLFKGVFDKLFIQLQQQWNRLDIDWIKNEITMLCRLFSESKTRIDCLDNETTIEQKKEINLGTLKKKWGKQFEQPWNKFLGKYGPKLFR